MNCSYKGRLYRAEIQEIIKTFRIGILIPTFISIPDSNVFLFCIKRFEKLKALIYNPELARPLR